VKYCALATIVLFVVLLTLTKTGVIDIYSQGDEDDDDFAGISGDSNPEDDEDDGVSASTESE